MSAADEPGYRQGVGIMLLNPAGEAFVGRRVDTRFAAWQMPQGGIDAGETPAAAARRELQEETGTDKAEIVAEARSWLCYELPQETAAVLWGGRYRGQRQKWFLMRFLGCDADIDLTGEHPEFDAWQWVAPERLPELIVPFKRRLYCDVLAEFEPFCRPAGRAGPG